MFNDTQIPRRKQLQPGYRHNGISTYRWKHPERGWTPIALEYYPERPEIRQIAAYRVLGTSQLLTPEQVRNGIGSGVLIPATIETYRSLIKPSN